MFPKDGRYSITVADKRGVFLFPDLSVFSNFSLSACLPAAPLHGSPVYFQTSQVRRLSVVEARNPLH